jgi:CO dehydrogenase maturation factor
MEQGRAFGLGDLSPGHQGLARVPAGHPGHAVQGLGPAHPAGREFHMRNATARASAAAGEDLAAQIDPDFTPGPPTPVTAC